MEYSTTKLGFKMWYNYIGKNLKIPRDSCKWSTKITTRHRKTASTSTDAKTPRLQGSNRRDQEMNNLHTTKSTRHPKRCQEGTESRTNIFGHRSQIIYSTWEHQGGARAKWTVSLHQLAKEYFERWQISQQERSRDILYRKRFRIQINHQEISQRKGTRQPFSQTIPKYHPHKRQSNYLQWKEPHGNWKASRQTPYDPRIEMPRVEQHHFLPNRKLAHLYVPKYVYNPKRYFQTIQHPTYAAFWRHLREAQGVAHQLAHSMVHQEQLRS